MSTAFLSTPSARRATAGSSLEPMNISISIHALREEGDLTTLSQLRAVSQFLSTPSARRATRVVQDTGSLIKISIHALREEGDPGAGRYGRRFSGYFYPRPPRGGRLRKNYFLGFPAVISIHALREEGDPPPLGTLIVSKDFYPRPPRGGRHGDLVGHVGGAGFLSTPSARRATLRERPAGAPQAISIHALREEGDFPAARSSRPPANFYPRPPRGGRRITR